MAKHRTVVCDSCFDKSRSKISQSVERWDEIFRGIEWALCRVPEKGQATSAPGIYALTTDDWPNVPAMVVYYQFDEDEVTLLDVRLADVPPTDGNGGS
jgi:hypothetical protein